MPGSLVGWFSCRASFDPMGPGTADEGLRSSRGRHSPMTGRRRRWRAGIHSRPALLVAFAFAVMADPVSSVAYSIEAALRALHGDLGLLLVTMGLVVGVVALVIVNYHQLVGRYPAGGGAAAAAGEAFGEAWAFIPIGALIVDFVLTIAISSAAGTSAIIAYLPSVAAWRIPIAVGLTATVAGLTWLAPRPVPVRDHDDVLHRRHHRGPHRGAQRALGSDRHRWPQRRSLGAGGCRVGVPGRDGAGHRRRSAVLGDRAAGPTRRRRTPTLGRITLWLTLGIVGTITLGLTAEAVHLHVGVPPADSTQIADLAHRATPGAWYGLFQLVTALLLLAAASSSFQAGPGLLKALARRGSGHGTSGVLPPFWGTTNRHHTPHWGVLGFFTASCAVILAADGQDQRLVLFYAVSVFLSFLIGLLAMARFAAHDHNRAHLALNVVGATAVGFTLAVNLARGQPIASLAAALLIAAILYQRWVTAGRPGGIRNVAAEADAPDPEAGELDPEPVP